MLAWLIIVPLGGPVVPLVYTSVASASGATASARRSNRSGSRCGPRLPDLSELGETEHEGVVEVLVDLVTLERHDALQLREPASHFEDASREVVVLDETHARLAIAEDVRHLLRGAGLVHGNGDAAVGEAAEIGDVPLRPVVREDADVPAGLDAELGQPGGDLGDRPPVVGVARRVPAGPDPAAKGRPTGESAQRGAERVDDGVALDARGCADGSGSQRRLHHAWVFRPGLRSGIIVGRWSREWVGDHTGAWWPRPIRYFRGLDS